MSVSKNLNYIKRMWAHPCATPDIEIVIETAFTAGAIAVFELALFGCTDIMKMRVGKSPWHTRKLGGFIKAVHPPISMDQQLGVFRLPYVVAEAGLWYMLVAEVASNFLPQWASMMYQMNGCALPGTGYIETGLSIGFGFPGDIRVVPAGGLDFNACVRFDGSGVTVTPGCYANITYTVTPGTFRPDLFGPGVCRFWLEDYQGNKSTVVSYNSEAPPQGNIKFGGMKLSAPVGVLGARAVVKMEILSGVMRVETGNIKASGYGRPIELVGSGCVPAKVVYPWQ